MKEDGVVVTGAFLGFAKAMRYAKMKYLHEGMMAKDLGLEEPESWRDRCETLFSTYAPQADEIGLKRNAITLQALLDLEIPDECMRMESIKLPTTFLFDPWLGMGRGGIRRIEPGEMSWAREQTIKHVVRRELRRLENTTGALSGFINVIIDMDTDCIDADFSIAERKTADHLHPSEQFAWAEIPAGCKEVGEVTEAVTKLLIAAFAEAGVRL